MNHTNMLSSANMDRVLASSHLPSPPTVALRLLELNQDLESSTKSFVDVIKSDPALAAKILKVANSSSYGCRAEVKTLDKAVTLIGRSGIASLALSFSLSNETMQGGPIAQHYRRVWLQSLVQASAAETLVRYGVPGNGDELFMTGLLLDLGQLALLKVHGESYAKVWESCPQGTTLTDWERSALGYSHVDVGVALLERWKLPANMIAANRFHHTDVTSLPENEEHRHVIQIMMAAAAAGEYICHGKSQEPLARLRAIALEKFNLSNDDLVKFLEDTDQHAKLAASLYSTNTDELPPVDELRARAAEQLAEIAIRQEQERQEIALKNQIAERRQAELEYQNARLLEQATRDPLTGVYNRRYFDDALSKEVARSARNGNAVAMLFVDADHFKQINDRYGHQVGDTCLIAIANTLVKHVRSTDLVARYGGEEFVVLVLDPTEAGLAEVAERMRQAVEQSQIMHENQKVALTVSIGGAFSVPDRFEQDLVPRLLESADAAMYESKRRGRNRVTIRTLASDFDRRISNLVMENRFSQWLVRRGVIDPAKAHEMAQSARPASIFIGELAVKRGWLTQDQVNYVLGTQVDARERFGAIAHELGLLTETQIAVLLAEQTEDMRRILDQLASTGVLSATETQLLFDTFLHERQQRLIQDGPSPKSSLVTNAVD